MSDLGRAFAHAFELIAGFDPELVGIVALSLRVSLTATLIAFLIGAPIGAALAVYRFPGRGALLVLVNALLGLPPVVAGLLVYLLVSRSGPLGGLGILFTPAAMIFAQALLALPIVVALVHRHMEGLWTEYGDVLRADGASRPRAVATLFNIGRHTRTMTTAITLETSKGDLPLALGLGIILVCLSLAVSASALALGRWR